MSKELYSFKEMRYKGVPIDALFYAIGNFKKVNYEEQLVLKASLDKEIEEAAKKLFLEKGLFLGQVHIDRTFGFNLRFNNVSLDNENPVIFNKCLGEATTQTLLKLIQSEAAKLEFFENEGSPFFLNTGDVLAILNKTEEEEFFEKFDEGFRNVFLELNALVDKCSELYFKMKNYMESEQYQADLFNKDEYCFDYLNFNTVLDVFLDY